MSTEGFVVACKQNTLFVLLGLPFLVLGTESTAQSLFFPSLLVSMTLLLCTTTSVNTALMVCVEAELQEFAMAFAIVIIHLLGDVPSNVVMGAVREAAGGKQDPRAWRWSFYSAEISLLPTVILWGAAAIVGRRIAAARLPVAKLEIYEDLLGLSRTPTVSDASLEPRGAAHCNAEEVDSSVSFSEDPEAHESYNSRSYITKLQDIEAKTKRYETN